MAAFNTAAAPAAALAVATVVLQLADFICCFQREGQVFLIVCFICFVDSRARNLFVLFDRIVWLIVALLSFVLSACLM